jgi:methionyl-tRNA formyltransferase
VRLVFAGSPPFAATILEGLLGRHDVRLVLTQPPEEHGRGRRLRPTEVALAAERHGLAVLAPTRLRTRRLRERMAQTDADVLVVAAYGRLLPASWLTLFPLGALNVHASLLPRWRGASPIAHAILAGDTESGVSIMRMTPSLDTGPVYRRCAEAVRDEDTAETLGARLAQVGVRCLLEVLDALASDPTIVPEEQNGREATYAPRLRKEDGRLDWTQEAQHLARRVRAFTPWPGTYTFLDEPCPDNRIRILEARAQEGISPHPPGTIVAVGGAGIDVACGTGHLRLTRLQRSGGSGLGAGDFLRGWRGSLLGHRFL